MNDIFVVIPTLNPNLDIFKPFLNKLKKEFKNIIVVNDGCREEYEEFFKNLEKEGITVLKHYVNLGKGRALKDAFNYLLLNYPSLKGVVTADSDGQHQIKDIKTCAKKVLNNPEALILGCRDFDGKNVPKRNRFGNKTTRSVFKIFVGLNITDTQTGLRGLSKEVMIKFLTTMGDRFEYETNQLIDSLSKKVPIKEFKIETVYIDGGSESHFNPIKDSLAIYKTFIKYIFASLSSFLLDIVLFALLSSFFKFSGYLITSTIIARIISSIYNYKVNVRMVFKSKHSSSSLKYLVLCIFQMFVSGILVEVLSRLIDINIVVLKLLIDLVIFIVNFIIQRELIFVDEKK